LGEDDVLRWLCVQANRRGPDFGRLRALMKKAEVMDKKQLQLELTVLSRTVAYVLHEDNNRGSISSA
jgi:hypothetical protein